MFLRARVKAPAKLNLHLEIGGMRLDGFHELVSLFQAISLSDELEFSRIEGDGIFLEGDFPFPAEENIILKACRLFFETQGFRSGLRIVVEKRIPMGGGLGGGSSDAAATLRALDALFERALSIDALADLGARLGSDVPFFLRAPCAIVAGRGELVEPIAAREDLSFVLVDPLFGVSTKEAYLLLDRERQGEASAAYRFNGGALKDAYYGRIGDWGFFNSFYPHIMGRHPELEEIRRELLESGAGSALMSGSGSTMFGIFSDSLAAQKAAQLQVERGYRAHVGFLLARNEDVILK